jgi:hypothetical protein
MLAACGKKGAANEAMDKQKAYADKLCACKDADCVTKEGQAYAKEMEEWAKKNAGKTADPGSISEADKKAMEELGKKIADCTSKAMAMKKDEPKKDEPKKDEPKAAEENDTQKAMIEVWNKVGDSIAANEKDCKKMGEELTKLTTDNKKTIDDINAWEKKEPEANKAWMEKHKGDMEAWMKKTEGGRKACEKDAKVAAAMKALE